jgi:predicted ATPase/DNA-binding CsgD family transcriptional regulator/Tfp pilus assembly protein PilF
MSTETAIIRGNLPAEPNRFIGRERDLAELAMLLTDVPMLTLSGTGGIGKTRLALRLAAEVRGGFPDGAWLVGLADLTDAALVLPRAATALGVREEPGRPFEATLGDALRDRRLLLILDNCEHLVTACARMCEQFLAASQSLRVLATSRQPLRVPGENVWRVPPLSVPPPGTPAQELADHEAVRLFAERAAAARPGFRLDAGNAAAVAALCRTLDGMPLAIELAAARVGALAVEQILTRLSDRFQLLAGGQRTAPPRQRTLRATVDWSHDLLTGPQQVLLRRLAVFSGWDLEMAQRVCADAELPAAAVKGLLAALVDKSLVTSAGQLAGRPRYRLLDTIRAYAAQRLAAAGEQAQVRRRHRDCLLGMVESTAAAAFTADGPRWPARLRLYRRIRLELDNYRAALGWSLERGEAEQGLRLCIGLRSAWVTDGDVAEGVSWLDRFVAAGPGAAPRILGHALVCRAELAFEQQEYESARVSANRGLADCTAAADQPGVAAALRVLGSVALQLGDAPRAHELSGQAVAAARAGADAWEEGLALAVRAAAAAHQGRVGEAERSYQAALQVLQGNNRWGIAHIRYGMGMLAQARGDHPAAVGHLRDALEVFGALDARPRTARCLAALGRIAVATGDYDTARSTLTQSLRLSRATGQRLAVARGLEAFAQLATCQGEHARAVRLAGAAAAIRTAIGAPPSSGSGLAEPIGPARQLLGAADVSRLLAEGAALTADEAVAYATQPSAGPRTHPQPGSPPGPPGTAAAAAAAAQAGVAAADPGSAARQRHSTALTPRELEVAELIARGLSNRAIAAELAISPATVAQHVTNILAKLGFSVRAQVAAWASGQEQRRAGLSRPGATP